VVVDEYAFRTELRADKFGDCVFSNARIAVDNDEAGFHCYLGSHRFGVAYCEWRVFMRTGLFFSSVTLYQHATLKELTANVGA